MILLANSTSNLMFGMGMCLLIMILLRRIWRYQGRSSQPEPVTARGTASALVRDAPTEVLQWQVEMHESARDLMGQLDTKMVALQVLIQQAREETARLQQALGQAPAGTSSSESALEEIAESGATQAEPSPPTLLQNADTAGRVRAGVLAGLTAAQIADREGLPLGEVELFLSLK